MTPNFMGNSYCNRIEPSATESRASTRKSQSTVSNFGITLSETSDSGSPTEGGVSKLLNINS